MDISKRKAKIIKLLEKKDKRNYDAPILWLPDLKS